MSGQGPAASGKSGARGSRWLFSLLILASLLFLVFIWHRNYNLLGDFYDYSIVTSASGHLQAGLKPYRDFATPLQSLTIYACYAAERVFGPRYLSLAYANLALGLVFFLLVLRLLKGRLPRSLQIVTSVALTVATVFQHGILWYNSIGVVLLIWLVLCSAVLFRERRLRVLDAAILSLLLFLSSMNKMNFHVLGLGMVFLILFLVWWLRQDRPGRFFYAAPILMLSGVILGPMVEILLNGTTRQAYMENVFETSGGRAGRLAQLLNPNLYLGDLCNAYPDNWSAGVYLKAFLIYCGCLYLIIRPGEHGLRSGSERESFLLKGTAAVMLAAFLVCGTLLMITNWETQLLTSSFFLAGLVCVFVMFAPEMSGQQRLGFQFGIFLLSAYFLLAGGLSAFMHSRVRFGEPSWTEAMRQAYKEGKLPALKAAVPFTEVDSMDPRLRDYFGGVRFTERSRRRLDKITAFLGRSGLNNRTDKVYWGPGLEILTRVYGNTPRGRLPLWYHLNTTVREGDAGHIIAELKKGDYECIISSPWIPEMPSEVRAYVQQNYEQVGDEEVPIYRRNP